MKYCDRMVEAETESPRTHRVRKLIRYMETVGGVITLAEAAAVTGTRPGVTLDTLLADATYAEPRLYEGEGWNPIPRRQGADYRQRLTVLGLLERGR